MGRMSIVQFAGAESRGGLLVHLGILARGLAEAGHDVHAVLSPAAGADACAAACAGAGAAITRLAVRGKGDLAGQARLRALVAAEDPDVFHLHLSSPVEAIPALLAARAGGAKHIVTTEHAPTWYPLRRSWSRAAKRMTAGLLDAIIAVCEADARFLQEEFGVPEELLSVIPNGVPDFVLLPREEARARLGLPLDAIVLGALGALEEKKGIGDLLEAATLLGVGSAGVPGLTVALAGEGSLEPLLRARSAHLPFRLELLGRKEDVEVFLAALDVFVLPSLQEALPLALLEAMRAGLPIVATRVGGIEEAVGDDREGLLVSPRRPAEIAAAVRRLVAQPELRARLGEAARRAAAERFSAQRMVDSVEALYLRTA